MKAVFFLCLILGTFTSDCGEGEEWLPTVNSCVPIGCERFTSVGCVGCKLGFQLKYGICTVAKCKLLDSLDFCAECSVGFEAMPNGFCRPINSIQYDQRSRKAQTCLNGFEKHKDGYCKVQNCQIHQDNSYSSCSTCSEGYEQRDGKCVNAHCVQIKRSGQCVKCDRSYVLDEEKGVCVSNMVFCMELNKFSMLCEKCQPGFHLVALRACVKEVKGCLEYSFDGCVKCSVGLEVYENSCRVRNCQKTNTKDLTTCEQCQNRYELSRNSYCKPENCDMFSEQSWTCNHCLGRYDLINGQCRTKNCIRFVDKTNVCGYCEPAYKLEKGDCLLQNCQTSKQEQCDRCLVGWKKNQEGHCLTRECQTYKPFQNVCTSCLFNKKLHRGHCIKDNCLYRSNGECLQCEKEYFIDRSSQFCVPYFCKDMNQQTGECFQCLDGFHFTHNQLICESVLCEEFQQLEGYVLPQCSKCKEGYKPFDRYCIPIRCNEFNLWDNRCIACQEGYKPEGEGCKVINCLDQSGDRCTRCSIGYEISDDGLCAVSNCLEGSNEECEECKHGFFAFGEICLASDCDEYADDGKCKVCLGRFDVQDDGTCHRSFCIDDSPTQCVKCLEGYIVGNAGFCGPLNCQETKSDSSGCSSCLEGYVSESHYCVRPDCQQFDDLYSCAVCREGFKLADGVCEIHNDSFCPLGQFFNPRNFLCERVKAPNCVFANPNKTQYCYKCEDGFYWRQGQCLAYTNCLEKSYYHGCLRCTPGYKVQQGECVPGIKHCASFSKQGKCEACMDKFYLTKNKKCFSIPAYCSQLDEEGLCTGCRDTGRVLRNSVCYLETENCFEYDDQSGLCGKCQKLYYLKGNKCLRNPVGCQIADTFGLCLECFDTHIYSEGKCHRFLDNCVGYDSEGNCSTCQIGYYETGGACKKTPPNCIQATSEGACSRCRLGFVSLSGICFRTIKYCEDYIHSSGLCKSCMKGYSPSRSQMFCLLE